MISFCVFPHSQFLVVLIGVFHFLLGLLCGCWPDKYLTGIVEEKPDILNSPILKSVQGPHSFPIYSAFLNYGLSHNKGLNVDVEQNLATVKP